MGSCAPTIVYCSDVSMIQIFVIRRLIKLVRLERERRIKEFDLVELIISQCI